jgi:phosphate transport system substrate-binding protein
MRTLGSRLIFFFIIIISGCGPRGSGSGTPAPSSEYIENRGSDTLVNLALAWAERYQENHPGVRISVTGGGSGTGIAALINGTVDLANASRAISPEELAAARANNVEPLEFVVARDAIAIIVNPHNPVDHLTMQQISDIYSGKIENWAEVGGEDRPIVRLSRETNSGTHVYFLEEVLRLGREDDQTLFSTDTLLLPSSEGITAEVRDNPNAIGYEGLGYITHDVKVLAGRPGRGYFGRGFCAPFRANCKPGKLSHRPGPLYVYSWPAGRGRQSIPGLDPRRRGPADRRRSWFRTDPRFSGWSDRKI